jgi:phosphohistidine phosphatase
MGGWLREQGLQPDAVISSPAKRAKQTVVRVCRELGVAKDAIIWDARIYSADVADLLTVLDDCPDEARVVLLVGHNPGLEEMLCHLCGGDVANAGSDKLLPTAALARLEIRGSWKGLKAGEARLVGMMRPRELPPMHQ